MRLRVEKRQERTLALKEKPTALARCKSSRTPGNGGGFRCIVRAPRPGPFQGPVFRAASCGRIGKRHHGNTRECGRMEGAREEAELALGLRGPAQM